MSPLDAARILGVPLDAQPGAIDAAYRAIARRTHPDRFSDEPVERQRAHASAFAEATRARHVLLAAVPGAAAPMRVVHLPRRHHRGLVAFWSVLLLAAGILGAWGSPAPLAPLDAIVRVAALAVGFVGWAVAGRRPLLTLGVIAFGATIVVTTVYTTIGALTGTLLMGPAILGLITAGSVEVRRRDLLQGAADAGAPVREAPGA